jgi:hypothetical protein
MVSLMLQLKPHFKTPEVHRKSDRLSVRNAMQLSHLNAQYSITPIKPEVELYS